MHRMSGLHARVRDGRLVLDEPTRLPEGTELRLIIDDGGDELDPLECSARDAALVSSTSTDAPLEADWWRVIPQLLPELSGDKLAAAIALVQAAPQLGQRIRHPSIEGLRRVPIGSTSFHLYYALASDGVSARALAVWSRTTRVPPRERPRTDSS
jgi:hypothetical protein